MSTVATAFEDDIATALEADVAILKISPTTVAVTEDDTASRLKAEAAPFTPAEPEQSSQGTDYLQPDVSKECPMPPQFPFTRFQGYTQEWTPPPPPPPPPYHCGVSYAPVNNFTDSFTLPPPPPPPPPPFFFHGPPVHLHGQMQNYHAPIYGQSNHVGTGAFQDYLVPMNAGPNNYVHMPQWNPTGPYTNSYRHTYHGNTNNNNNGSKNQKKKNKKNKNKNKKRKEKAAKASLDTTAQEDRGNDAIHVPLIEDPVEDSPGEDRSNDPIGVSLVSSNNDLEGENDMDQGMRYLAIVRGQRKFRVRRCSNPLA